LNVALFDLQPDWGVSQVFPQPSAGPFHPLDPDASVPVPLQAFLPDGLDAGTDVLKVFASTGPVSFRWLELPALYEAGGPGASAQNRGGLGADAPGCGGSSNPLARLRAALGTGRAPAAVLRSSDPASYEWTTAQVELRVVRGSGS
jgi:hypothetical protein